MTNVAVVDTSVLFSACHSLSGSARDLVDAALDGNIAVAVSSYILAEVRRNLVQKSDHGLAMLNVILASGVLSIVEPDHETIQAIASVVAGKDAPVIAAAMAARAPVVATYDRRHLLSRADEILRTFGVEVLTPDEVLRRLETAE